MKTQWRSEAHFQAACFAWFDKEYPEQRGRLIGIYNNPPNISQLISMGLQPGISDFEYRMRHKIAWIELKIGNRPQSDKQKTFEQRVLKWGDEYYLVCEELTYFINLIKNLNNGH